MIKGYIFDLDGTLLDSLEVWKGVGNRYLLTIDIQGDPHLDAKMEHMSLKEAAIYIKEKFNLTQSVEDIIEGVCLQIEEKYEKEVELKQGAKEFLEKCHNKGYQMTVLTASSDILAKKALKRLGVLKYFKEIYSCQTCGYNKTQIESYLSIAKEISLKKEECIVVEDALYAIETAVQAGFFVKAIYDRHNQKDWLKICQIANKNYKSFYEMEV